jgi:hypothetical protein
VQCIAAGDILFQRFKARAELGERHLGHVDHLDYAEFQTTLIPNRHYALEIGGSVIEVNTTDFQQIDYDRLSTTVRLALVQRDGG